jgi:hypothetical protein
MRPSTARCLLRLLLLLLLLLLLATLLRLWVVFPVVSGFVVLCAGCCRFVVICACACVRSVLGITETIDGQPCSDTQTIRALIQTMDTHLSRRLPPAEPYLMSVEPVLESADQSATVVRGWDRALSWAMFADEPLSAGQSVNLIGAGGERLIRGALVASSDADSVTVRGRFPLEQL